MKAWRRFWFGFELEPARLVLLRVTFFGVLGVDMWNQVSHAPRYGSGGLSIPHVDLLTLLPAPHRELVLVLFCTAAFLSFRAACGVAPRLSAALVAGIFGLVYFWSQVDSYQHHYLVWMVVALTAFFPWTPTGRTRDNWPVRLLLVQLGLVYLWASIAKMDSHWLEGRTLSMQISKDWVRSWVMGVAKSLDTSPLTLWSVAAWAVMLGELALAFLLQIRRAWPLALLLGVGFHLGVEVLGYKIGLFSYFMFALYTLILPDRIIALAARVYRPMEPGTSRAAALVLSLVGAALALALPFPSMGALAGVLAVLGLATAWRRPGLLTGMAHLVAGLALLTLNARTDQARDYYKYLGGDTRRRGEVEVALDAYANVLRLDPTYVSGWIRLGDLHLRRGLDGDLEAGLEAYIAATEHQPRRASSWSRVAQAHERLGQDDQAMEAAERALSIDPEDADGRAVLRRLAPATPNP